MSVIAIVVEPSLEADLATGRLRCPACEQTHVLLPAWAVTRRRDGTEVIGHALLANANGHGHRRIAAELGRPAGTVPRLATRARPPRGRARSRDLLLPTAARAHGLPVGAVRRADRPAARPPARPARLLKPPAGAPRECTESLAQQRLRDVAVSRLITTLVQSDPKRERSGHKRATRTSSCRPLTLLVDAVRGPLAADSDPLVVGR